MHAIQILTLLLALSTALNIGFSAGVIAGVAGANRAQAILVGAGASGSVLTIFFAALSVYS
jgi:hypothetical protein